MWQSGDRTRDDGSPPQLGYEFLHRWYRGRSDTEFLGFYDRGQKSYPDWNGVDKEKSGSVGQKIGKKIA
jgi:hypothetical protein